jgi:hypothetical protein
MRYLLVALMMLLPINSDAWAWGDEGRNEIGFRLVQPNTRAEIQRLIRTDTEFHRFSDSCIWPDHPRKRAAEHFVNLARDSRGLTPDDPCLFCLFWCNLGHGPTGACRHASTHPTGIAPHARQRCLPYGLRGRPVGSGRLRQDRRWEPPMADEAMVTWKAFRIRLETPPTLEAHPVAGSPYTCVALNVVNPERVLAELPLAEPSVLKIDITREDVCTLYRAIRRVAAEHRWQLPIDAGPNLPGPIARRPRPR